MDMAESLLTSCRLVISDKVPTKDGKLYKLLTETCHFYISGFDPLVVEKSCPSEQDIQKLFDALKEFTIAQETEDYDFIYDLQNDHAETNIQTSEKSLGQKLSRGKHGQNTDNVIRRNCRDDSKMQQFQSQTSSVENCEADLISFFEDLHITSDLKDQECVIESNSLMSFNSFENVCSGNEFEQTVHAEAPVVKLEQDPFTLSSNSNYTSSQMTNQLVDSRTELLNPCVEGFTKDSTKIRPNNQNQEAVFITDSGRKMISSDTNSRNQLAVEGAVHPFDPESKLLKNKNEYAGLDVKSDLLENNQMKHRSGENTVQTTAHLTKCAQSIHENDFCKTNITSVSEMLSIKVVPQTLADHSVPGNAEDNNVSDSTAIPDKQQETIRNRHIKNEKWGKGSQDNSGSEQSVQVSEVHSKNRNLKQTTNIEEIKDYHICNATEISKDYNSTKEDKNKLSSKDRGHEEGLSSSSELDGRKDETLNQTAFEATRQKKNKISVSSDSSESEDEPQEKIIYPMRPSQFFTAKIHFAGSKFSNYFEKIPTGAQCVLKLIKQNKEDAELLKMLKKLKFEEFDILQREETLVASAIKDVCSEVKGLTLHQAGNKINLMGPEDEVATARKMLTSRLIFQNPTTHLFSENFDRNYENTKVRRLTETEQSIPDVHRMSDKKELAFSRSEITSRRATSPVKSYKTDWPRIERRIHTSPEGRDVKSGLSHDRVNTSKTSHYDINFQANGSRVFTTAGNITKLKIHVYKADITKLNVECIVNSANRKLQNSKGVTNAIFTAAGPTLKNECDDYTSHDRTVNVTEIFVSNGGELYAKKVIHAVGPKWDNYEENNKQKCFDDLRHTVLRCLVEANRLHLTSIAIPSVSAAGFRVPKQSCARCYMEAVKHFDVITDKENIPLHLNDIHFVDLDDEMVKLITEQFTKNWRTSSDSKVIQKDRDFYMKHLSSVKKDQKFLGQGSSMSSYNNPTSSSSSIKPPVAASARQPNASYRFGNILLHLSSRPAFDHMPDITFTIGKPFNNLSGIDGYKISPNLRKHESIFQKNAYKCFHVSKPNGKHSRLVCEVFPEPEHVSDIEDAFKNLEKAFQSCYNRIPGKVTKSVVMTSDIMYFVAPSKKQQSKGEKKVEKFVQCLHEYLKKARKDIQEDISVIVVGCENSVHTAERVIESYGNRKTAPGAYPKAKHGTERHENDQDAHTFAYHGNEASFKAGYGTESKWEVSEFKKRHESEKDAHTFAFRANEETGSSVDPKQECKICVRNVKISQTSCCRNLICQTCEQKCKKCPFCNSFWKIVTGNQPPGFMTVRKLPDYADGYENYPSYEIEYYFPPGIQNKSHPNPGRSYNSSKRTAYLPANSEGHQVLLLLRLAFIRRLTFTIGKSLTTGQEDVITWNDIHHKTKLHGELFGYPDEQYLNRVTTELAEKGVTFDDLTGPETHELEGFNYKISRINFFTDKP